MRHKVAGWKLGRNTSHRRSLLRNLVTSLIIEERIETTIPKARFLDAHIVVDPARGSGHAMGAETSKAMEGWPAELRREFAANGMNGCVGQVLLSESDRVRVW